MLLKKFITTQDVVFFFSLSFSHFCLVHVHTSSTVCLHILLRNEQCQTSKLKHKSLLEMINLTFGIFLKVGFGQLD
jgi:hypothetical protein